MRLFIGVSKNMSQEGRPVNKFLIAQLASMCLFRRVGEKVPVAITGVREFFITHITCI